MSMKISTADIGNKFVATFKSLGSIKLQEIGKQELQSSTTNITKAFSFDKFNSTHLGITFYAWFTDANAPGCSFHFDFPDYDVLKGNTILPPITVPPTTSLFQIPTQQPLETANTGVPEKSISTSKKTSTSSENISISSTVFYIIVGVSTLVLMILINAVTLYFVLSRFSNSKPPENGNTKFDAEETKTKVTTLQYNFHNYFPNIKTKIHNKTYNTVEQNGPYAAAATGNVANVSNANNKCPSKQQNTVMAASPKK